MPFQQFELARGRQAFEPLVAVVPLDERQSRNVVRVPPREE